MAPTCAPNSIWSLWQPSVVGIDSPLYRQEHQGTCNCPGASNQWEAEAGLEPRFSAAVLCSHLPPVMWQPRGTSPMKSIPMGVTGLTWGAALLFHGRYILMLQKKEDSELLTDILEKGSQSHLLVYLSLIKTQENWTLPAFLIEKKHQLFW